ncbi:MAG: Error-prone repair protein ImuA [Bacteroidota bacterium]
MKHVADRAVIEALQKQIVDLQTSQQPSGEPVRAIGLGELESAFPDGAFPKGVVHELISTSSEGATCTSAFMAVILGKIMQQSGYCLWISTIPRRSIYPPALKAFGINPEKILFVDTPKTKDTLWAIEEALKCDSLVAVVGELTELNFNESRRLQLAVEKSHVTGFIHRFQPKTQNAVACVTRWQITPLASTESDRPGLGFSRWDVQLLKVRNGQPANWQVQWSPDGLEYIHTEHHDTTQIIQLQTG